MASGPRRCQQAALAMRCWRLFLLHVAESSSLEGGNCCRHVWTQEFVQQLDALASGAPPPPSAEPCGFDGALMAPGNVAVHRVHEAVRG